MKSKVVLEIPSIGSHISSYGNSGQSSLFQYFPESKRITNVAGCRETFAGGWTGQTDHIGLTFGRTGGFDHVNDFFDRIEEQMNLKVRTQIFSVKDRADVLILHLSPVWLSSATARSLITLLLRFGTMYHCPSDKTFSWAKYSLAANTSPSIEHWLKGNIHPKNDGIYPGWASRYNLFYEQNYIREGIDKALLPATSEEAKEYFGKLVKEEPKPAAPKVRIYAPRAKFTLKDSLFFGETGKVVKESANYVVLKFDGTKDTKTYKKASVEEVNA